jgi:conjugative relaxase-like TrwC/TraI family protein
VSPLLLPVVERLPYSTICGMLTLRAISNGEGYSARHLEHNDYYDEQGKVTGRWLGRGAERLGLSGAVKTPAFEAAREGVNPTTGEKLRPRKSADRVRADGSKQSQAVNLYDLTFSAPKSVSIMAGPGGDARLLAAHDAAVQEALSAVEVSAAARVRVRGANEDRATGNLIVAAYRHDTSRELDPQVHTHCVAANLTFDQVENRWKALQAGGIYQRRAFFSEVYRNALAREVGRLGYETVDRRDAKGKDLGFEIAGVSPALLEKFSQRSAQRDDAIARFVQSRGRTPTNREVAVLVRETRADKLTEISTRAVKEKQKARLAPDEARALQGLREEAQSRLVLDGKDQSRECLQYAFDHVFERVSVARDYDVLTEALRHGRGHVDAAGLRKQLETWERAGAVLRSRDEITTRESLDRERTLIATVNQGLDRFERLGGRNAAFEVSSRLNEQQKKAVNFVLDSRDFAVNLRGAAGAGKTTTLQEIHRGLRAGGRQVAALAPSQSAVEELERAGFRGAMTLQRLLVDDRAQAALRGKVVVLDEAGMVSAKQMGQFVSLARSAGARVIFSGDTQQLQSVEAGDALRILELESKLQGVTLTKLERQKSAPYKAAMEALRRDPERGLEMLEAMGAIHEASGKSRPQAVAAVYALEQSKGSVRGGQRAVLVVCPTHDEIARVTEAIRANRRARGDLGQGQTVDNLVALNWTLAQRREAKRFKPGQVLVFHKATKTGVKKHQAFEVVGVERGKIRVRDEAGAARSFSRQQAGCFGVFQRRSMEVAAGDKLLLLANRRGREFKATNGELVTVSSVAAGSIRLEDGRALPANFKQFMHGYAVTAHRSQGKTVDSVIISGDGMRRELFYVAATRGRESIRVITGNLEALKASVQASSRRRSATTVERDAGIRQWLARQARGRPRRGRGRSIAVALAQLVIEPVRALAKASLRVGQSLVSQRGTRERGNGSDYARER